MSRGNVTRPRLFVMRATALREARSVHIADSGSFGAGGASSCGAVGAARNPRQLEPALPPRGAAPAPPPSSRRRLPVTTAPSRPSNAVPGGGRVSRPGCNSEPLQYGDAARAALAGVRPGARGARPLHVPGGFRRAPSSTLSPAASPARAARSREIAALAAIRSARAAPVQQPSAPEQKGSAKTAAALRWRRAGPHRVTALQRHSANKGKKSPPDHRSEARRRCRSTGKLR